MTPLNDRDPSDDNVRRFLANWKPAYVVGVDENDTEHRITVPSTTKRWEVVVKSLRDLDCVRVRCYDRADAVLGTKVLRTIETNGIGQAVQPATSGGVDVAAIIQTTTQSMTTAFERLIDAVAVKVVGEITKSHAVSFNEMVNMAKLSNERAMLAEKERQALLAEREKRIEDEEERLEDERERAEEERERAEAEREKEREESKEFGEVGKMLLAAAGPGLIEKFTAQKKDANGAAPPVKVKVDAKKIPDAKPAPEGGGGGS